MAAAEAGFRDVVKFEPNQPVEVALKYAAGKTVRGIGGDRVMFSLVDGRVMFLDPEPARQVDALGVKPGEPFQVCMNGKRGEPRSWTAWLSADAEQRRAQAEARAKGDRWTERMLGEKIERREESRAKVIGALPKVGDGAAVSRTAAPAQAAPTPSRQLAQPLSTGNGSRNGGQDGGQGSGAGGQGSGAVAVAAQVAFPWAARLLSETNALVDVYAAAAAYAKVRYGGRVTSEDVLQLVSTAYVSRQNGGCDAA
jgi:hypothetical protein